MTVESSPDGNIVYRFLWDVSGPLRLDRLHITSRTFPLGNFLKDHLPRECFSGSKGYVTSKWDVQEGIASFNVVTSALIPYDSLAACGYVHNVADPEMLYCGLFARRFEG